MSPFIGQPSPGWWRTGALTYRTSWQTMLHAHHTDLFFFLGTWESYIFQLPGIEMSNSGKCSVGRSEVCLFHGWFLKLLMPPCKVLSSHISWPDAEESWGQKSQWREPKSLTYSQQESLPVMAHLDWTQPERKRKRKRPWLGWDWVFEAVCYSGSHIRHHTHPNYTQ